MSVAAGVLLVAWGVLNALGGFAGSANHPAPHVGPLFLTTGTLIAIGDAGYVARRSWRLAVSATGLAALSLLALYSAAVLRGWSQINVAHHAVRLLISAGLLAFAIATTRTVRGGRL